MADVYDGISPEMRAEVNVYRDAIRDYKTQLMNEAVTAYDVSQIDRKVDEFARTWPPNDTVLTSRAEWTH